MPPREISVFEEAIEVSERERRSSYHKARETLHRLGSHVTIEETQYPRSWMQHVVMALDMINTWSSDYFRTRIREELQTFIEENRIDILGDHIGGMYQNMPKEQLRAILFKGISELNFPDCIESESLEPDLSGFTDAVRSGLESFSEERQTMAIALTLEIYTHISRDVLKEVDQFVQNKLSDLLDAVYSVWIDHQSDDENWQKALQAADEILGEWDSEVRYIGDQ